MTDIQRLAALVLAIPAAYLILYAGVRVVAAAYFKSKQQFYKPTTERKRDGTTQPQ